MYSSASMRIYTKHALTSLEFCLPPSQSRAGVSVPLDLSHAPIDGTGVLCDDAPRIKVVRYFGSRNQGTFGILCVFTILNSTDRPAL